MFEPSGDQSVYPTSHVGVHVLPLASVDVQSPTPPFVGATDASHVFVKSVLSCLDSDSGMVLSSPSSFLSLLLFLSSSSPDNKYQLVNTVKKVIIIKQLLMAYYLIYY